MLSTHEGELDIPALPLSARLAHVVPALTDQSLISIGQLCDSGCDVTFNATSVNVTLEGNPIFSGTRNATTKLWNLTAPKISHANGAIGAPTASNLL